MEVLFYLTNQKYKDFDITDYLRNGAESAISAKTLAALAGLPERIITLAVMIKRREGIPVCSNDEGYFMPTSAEEVQATISNLKSRETEIGITRRAMEQALTKQFFSQLSMKS